jgi:hypothetical protein
LLVNSLQKQPRAGVKGQSERRDAQGRFLKGETLNPEGSFRRGSRAIPPGARRARNKATLVGELLLDGEAEALTGKARVVEIFVRASKPAISSGG